MSEAIKQEAAINYMKQMVDTIKTNIKSLKMPEINNIRAKKDLDDFLSYFENAVSSSTPFIDNVHKMREQGIWLPEKITDASVKKGYYSLAKGYFYKVFNNESFMNVLFMTQTKQSREIQSALQNINKLLNEIIEGKRELI